MSRPRLKHLRVIEQAVLEAGATSVTWSDGGKHPRLWIHLPDGRRIYQTLPGSTSYDQLWLKKTRLLVERALSGRNNR